MPLVRIDMMRGTPAAYRQQVGDVIYAALLGFGAPEGDRFQIITEHNSGNFHYAPNYLGIERTDALIVLQITAVEGRTVEQKRALYLAIADGLAAIGHRREDVLINLVETAKADWSFGLGLAQYAPE